MLEISEYSSMRKDFYMNDDLTSVGHFMTNVWNDIWKKNPFPPRIRWYAEDFLQYLIKWSSTKRSGLFLEAGAGSGRFSYQLSIRGCEIVALDLSRDSISLLRKLKEMNRGFLHVIRADIAHMPFRDFVFDVVYSEGVVEHFQDASCVLTEMARVLQRRGVLIFGVPNVFSFHTIARFAATKLLGGWFYGFERSFSKGEVESSLCRLGLESVEVHGIGLFYGVGRNMPYTIRTLLYRAYVRLRGTRLGAVFAECFGFQIVGKAEK